MDEGRKRVLLMAASILAARKLAHFDGGKRVPATVSAIADAVHRTSLKSMETISMSRIGRLSGPRVYARLLLGK